VVIHHVKVHGIRPGFECVIHFLAQTGEIRRENGRCNPEISHLPGSLVNETRLYFIARYRQSTRRAVDDIDREAETIDLVVDSQFQRRALPACHGVKGEGRKGIAPALDGNSIFSLDDYYNSVAVVLRGLAPDHSNTGDGLMPMASLREGIPDARASRTGDPCQKLFWWTG
jgi:hypothetical protein